VIGTLRNPDRVPSLSSEFAASGRLILISLDVRGGRSITGAARQISEPIDVLINNAGIIGPQRQSTPGLDFDGFLETFAINTLGPLQVAQAFLPNPRRAEGAKIVTISSRMGSLSYARSDRIAYRASKAAVNKVMQGLATDLQAEGIVAITAHPGLVRTDMGGAGADITVEESAAGLIRLIDGLTLKETGGFFDWQGAVIPF